MANWKTFINSRFSGCQLLAFAHDNCRNREVRIYRLPGVAECVGIADGTDQWIAPVSASLFSVNVARIIEDGEAGKGWPKPVPPAGKFRRPLVIAEETKPRRALIEEPAADQPPTKARRALVL